MKQPLLVIAGPTASGKTALSIKLAKKYNGEIVNCDSMQVYKYMDIGTAKPTIEEREGIPHHLIDVVEPTVNFSLGDYIKLATNAVEDIQSRGKLPIMVGGTGLYIDTFVYNIDIGDSGQDLELRKKLYEVAENEGNDVVHKMLQAVDKESADRIHPENLKRVIRALEVYHITGKTMTEIQNQSRLKEPKYDHKIFAISIDRELLYERINKRVNIMLESGLEKEVINLRNMGVTLDNTAMQGIGYKELYSYLQGEISIDEAIEAIKQGSRRYAKRQITWFKRNKEINWLDYNKLQ